MRPDEMTDDIEEAIIDHEVSLLTRGQIDLAWRSLCAHMIYAAVASYRVKIINKYCVENRIAARKWMQGGGVVTFNEACETVNLDGERVHALLSAEKKGVLAINSERRHPDARFAARENQDTCRLVAAGAAFAASGVGEAGAAAGICGGGCSGFPGEQDPDRYRRQTG